MKKKILIGLLTVLTACVLCFGLAACNLAAPAGIGGSAYVAVDINPSVELTVQNGVVTSVRALNYDARVMLYGSEGIVGKTPEEAARAIAALALKYGYVTAANSDLGLTVASEDERIKAEIFAKVSDALTEEAGKGGLAVTVNADAGAAAERELAKLKAAYPDDAKVQALTAADYRIVRAALNADKTLTVAAAVAMDFDELTEIIEDAYEKFGAASDNKLELALEKAEAEYLAAEWAIVAPGYIAADPALGTEYAALRAAYLTLDRIEEIDGELAELAVFTDDDLLWIAAKLGLSEQETAAFVATVRDEEGFIDGDSIEYYLDKLERNAEENDDDDLEDLLDEIEDYLDAAADRAEALPAELQAQAVAALATVREYIGETEIPATFDDLEDAAEMLEERLEEVEERIDDFTDAQKQIVRDHKESVKDELAAAKAAYDEAVAALKTAAADALEAAQRLRLTIVA